jgi:uncharacterized protein (TIGR00255 family)
MMIRSMTGFGRASGSLSGRFTAAIAVRTVNHRNLELSVRVPENLWEIEPAIRALAGEHFSRGKVDIAVRLQRITEPEYQIRVNARVANAVLPQLRAMLEEHGMTNSLSGSDLMRVPDLIQVEALDHDWDEGEQEQLRSLLRTAFESVNLMREKEGEGLRRDILSRLTIIAERRNELESGRETVTREATDAFLQRVSDIARSTSVEISEERVSQEIVLLLDRMDIAEELTRLALHVEQMRATLGGGEAVGKKLDFLAQEMMREVNTIGSKSKSAAIRSAVIELKTEVERIREQVQNVE